MITRERHPCPRVCISKALDYCGNAFLRRPSPEDRVRRISPKTWSTMDPLVEPVESRFTSASSHNNDVSFSSSPPTRYPSEKVKSCSVLFSCSTDIHNEVKEGSICHFQPCRVLSCSGSRYPYDLEATKWHLDLHCNAGTVPRPG